MPEEATGTAALEGRSSGIRSSIRFVALLGGLWLSSVAESAAPGVQVPAGFEATLFADDELAHDIYSMTVDSLGRVVVSGGGYIRILIDSDGDGKADEARQFADGPKTGAQGMHFVGRNLFCSGDTGVLLYRDANGDDRADGPPVNLLKIKAGSEHDVHGLRKGPDGWWYVIAGNNAGVNEAYAGLSTSPVRKPYAGTLLRLKPDMSAGEVLADGFRNAYDFAFTPAGDVFTFDSDGEREVSLPWYRPTRVIHVVAGGNAGWHSRSWKRPDYFLDMPPVAASFGRGSPTGVVCYRHEQFPAPYRGALFVLDWTFGRVLALPLGRRGSTWDAPRPQLFMTAVGQFGFAPTDVAVGPDGSLYVSVGGRGTRGGVYRIRYTARATDAPSESTELEKCLGAPQPLSSWSRAEWMPLAKRLGKETFLQAVRDEDLSLTARLRAVEIATELFDGLDDETHRAVLESGPALLQSRAAWSLGRSEAERPNKILILAAYLSHPDPHVVRTALEALLSADLEAPDARLIAALAKTFASEDQYVRLAAARLVPRLGAKGYRELALQTRSQGWQAGMFTAVGDTFRRPGFNAYALDMGARVLARRETLAVKLEAVRLMQRALGDVGSGNHVPLYDGYAPLLDLAQHERELDKATIAAIEQFPSGSPPLDAELARLFGMLRPYNSQLLDKILARINRESHPVSDIHYLIVASRIPTERTSGQCNAITGSLIDLQRKIDERKLRQDSNWDPRIGELYKAFVERDPELPARIVQHPGFGRPAHVLFLSELPKKYLPAAVAAFVAKINADADYPFNSDVIFVLGESADPAHRRIVRKQYENFALRSAVLMVLAEKPAAADREKFVAGLQSGQVGVLSACVNALMKLPPADATAAENVALVILVRRLGADKSEFPLRENVVRLLRRNTGRAFGFEFGRAGYRGQPHVIDAWTSFATKAYPDHAAELLGGSETERARLAQLLERVDWERGDVSRGQKLLASRACTQCHSGGRALGPDLAGAARRFSRDDLFTAIALPNRDVSNRYQTTAVETEDGRVYSGLVIYRSVDGIILRDANNRTYRIEADEIVEQRTLPTSLMPTGLLKDLTAQDLADLYAAIKAMSG